MSTSGFFNDGLHMHAEYSLVFSIVSIDIHKISDMLRSVLKTSNNYEIILFTGHPLKKLEACWTPIRKALAKIRVHRLTVYRSIVRRTWPDTTARRKKKTFAGMDYCPVVNCEL